MLLSLRSLVGAKKSAKLDRQVEGPAAHLNSTCHAGDLDRWIAPLSHGHASRSLLTTTARSNGKPQRWRQRGLLNLLRACCHHGLARLPRLQVAEERLERKERGHDVEKPVVFAVVPASVAVVYGSQGLTERNLVRNVRYVWDHGGNALLGLLELLEQLIELDGVRVGLEVRQDLLLALGGEFALGGHRHALAHVLGLAEGFQVFEHLANEVGRPGDQGYGSLRHCFGAAP